jgi:signal transduction histidine kinase/CheY-like chemotaxis protein
VSDTLEADPRPLPPAAANPARELQVQFACRQVQRSPWVVVAADAFVVWLFWRAHSPHAHEAIAWLAVATMVGLARAMHGRRLLAAGGAWGEARQRQLTLSFLAVGATRVWPIAFAFDGGDIDLPYLVTMVMMGLAAGGVTTSAGVTSLYVAWCVPVCTGLVAGWISLRTFEGSWIAVLLILMFALLVSYVRDYGRTLRRQFDLAQRLQRERDRAETERERAENAIVARTRFFAAASHDLRQPLSALRWFGAAVVEHARQMNHAELKMIGENIERILEMAQPLLRQYLEIARIDAHSREVAMVAGSVPAVLELVLDAHAREAIECKLNLRTSFGDPVARLFAHSDFEILQGIVSNLVGNALKFTPAGEVVLHAARAGPGGEWVRVSVRDTGIGIAPENHERIFDDFYQVGNPSRMQSKGVGLGLAIVRRQVERLGVRLHVESSVGHGSTFWFELPAADATPPPPAAAAGGAPAQGRSLQVLVVDDEPSVRLSLRMMLEAVGWTVRTASGLPQAVHEIQGGFAPDVLLVDFRLQDELSGIEVVGELHASGCEAPALILTGDTTPQTLADIQARGLTMLDKSRQGSELLTTIRRLVDKGS